jgi:hypothetical protein
MGLGSGDRVKSRRGGTDHPNKPLINEHVSDVVCF